MPTYRVKVTAEVIDTLSMWVTVDATDATRASRAALYQAECGDLDDWRVASVGSPTNLKVDRITEEEP